jgi:hypothetical protein
VLNHRGMAALGAALNDVDPAGLGEDGRERGAVRAGRGAAGEAGSGCAD